MLILSRVCVEFRSPAGVPVFEITPAMVHTFQEAPDIIRQDPIFDLLLSDGSLEAAVPEKRRKELEQDPIQDTDASGKKIRPEKEAAPEAEAPGEKPEPEQPAPEKPPVEKNEKNDRKGARK